LGGVPFNVLTLSASGSHPDIKVEGDRLIVGKQIITFNDGKLALGTFTPRK
jgi:hypothetical protein